MTGSSSFWFANSSSGFYNGVVEQSLRLDESSSSHLTFTPSSAGNQKKCTISAWVKRSSIGDSGATEDVVFHAGTSLGHRGHLRFYEDHINWNYYNGSSWILYLITTDLFRDTTNWYHLCANVDTIAGTAKLWVNGVEPTLSSNTIPSSSQDLSFADDIEHQIGERGAGTTGYFHGYIADVHFIDGDDLAYSEFAEFKNGVLIPKKYTGSYGTNGFRLEFKQTGTSADASGIGADTSGNTNHFTSNNLSAHDSNLPDSPENNFATLNALQKGYASTPLTEGNLKLTGTGSAGAATYSFKSSSVGMTFPTYWEVLVNALTATGRNGSGILAEDFDFDGYGGFSTDLNGGQSGKGHGSTDFYNETSDVNDVTAESVGDIAMYAFDPSSGKLWHGVNGTWSNSGNPASDSNPTSTVSALLTWFPSANIQSSSDIVTFNFGQDSSFAGAKTAQGNSDGNGNGDFYYSPPSGFLALCTANLSEPTLGPNADEQANDHFESFIYSGNSDSSRTISGFNFQADLMWNKARNQSFSHRLYDSTRGNDKSVSTSTNASESTYDLFNGFTSDGFNTTTDGTAGDLLNYNGGTYVSWIWKANGGTTSSNSNGSITSTVQANTTSGFSIITYTGTGSAATVGHGLSSAPEVVWIKNRTDAREFVFGHASNTFGGQQYLTTDGAYSANSGSFNSTAPTSTVVSVGGDQTVNESSDSMVMYCFHSVEGYSKFGTYKGNGNSDGSYIYTGFTPNFIMVKRTDSADNFAIYDGARDTFNVRDSYLLADAGQAETTYSTAIVDFLSNGFKWRGAVNFGNNSSGTYVYMAFASLPFKHSNAI